METIAQASESVVLGVLRGALGKLGGIVFHGPEDFARFHRGLAGMLFGFDLPVEKTSTLETTASAIVKASEGRDLFQRAAQATLIWDKLSKHADETRVGQYSNDWIRHSAKIIYSIESSDEDIALLIPAILESQDFARPAVG